MQLWMMLIRFLVGTLIGWGVTPLQAREDFVLGDWIVTHSATANAPMKDTIMASEAGGQSMLALSCFPATWRPRYEVLLAARPGFDVPEEGRNVTGLIGGNDRSVPFKGHLDRIGFHIWTEGHLLEMLLGQMGKRTRVEVEGRTFTFDTREAAGAFKTIAADCTLRQLQRLRPDAK